MKKNETAHDSAFGFGYASGPDHLCYRETGLNKREYFAAAAMQGLCSSLGKELMGQEREELEEIAALHLAQLSVICADVLLEQLAYKPKTAADTPTEECGV